MEKTKRDLLYAIAERIGGEHAIKIRAILAKKTTFDDILDRQISDEEFALQLKKAEQDLPKVLARIQSPAWAKSGEWGSN